jgi:hypothetical protein
MKRGELGRPTNDLANRELSIEELEAIAAGGWLGDAFRWVEHKAEAVAGWVFSPGGQKTLGDILRYIGRPVENRR